MKRYLKFFCYILLSFSVVSCEDYLATESKSTLTEETTFGNLDFATKAVYGVYEQLTSNPLYDYNFMFYKADNDIEVNWGANNGAVYNISHYSATEGTNYLQQVWNDLYSGIEKANLCIDNLPESALWEGEHADEAHRLYGEAVTLRAYFYSELIHHWGDVPFKTRSTQAGDEFNLPKADRDSIYEFLIQDLKEVEDYVPWMSKTQTTERINKAFVKGLRARIALAYAGYSLRNKTFETRRGRYWEEYYKIANQECREVMESGEHQFNPDFENIFKNLHVYSMDLTYKEVLFEIAFGRLLSRGRVAESWGIAHNATADKKYGRAPSRLSIPLTYYYSFDRSDVRRDVSIEMYSYSGSGVNAGIQVLASANALGWCKFRREWINPSLGGDMSAATFTGVNWPMMRYSDIVLMFAETENQINGPTQAAKDALALVRKRAFPEALWASKVTHYVDSVSTGREAFFNAIVDERGWELGGECIRKQDLVRWNLLGTKINQMKTDMQKIYDDDESYAYHDKVPNYIFWKRNADGETIDIMNPDYRLPETAISGYTRSAWVPLYSASNKAKQLSNVANVANGYDPAKNNHLQPIYIDLITASNGVLSNDQLP